MNLAFSTSLRSTVSSVALVIPAIPVIPVWRRLFHPAGGIPAMATTMPADLRLRRLLTAAYSPYGGYVAYGG